MKSLDLARTERADKLLDVEILRMNALIRSNYGLETLVTPWSERWRVVSDGDGGWVFGPVELDPTSTADGRLVIPRQQRRHLRTLADRGLPVQRLAVAHEVATMPRVYREPHPCTLDEARQLVGPVPPHPRLARTVRALDSLAGAATVGASVAARMLDPIVFGVIAPTQPEEGEPAVWMALAAWRW
jgi:hypothetical protein